MANASATMAAPIDRSHSRKTVAITPFAANGTRRLPRGRPPYNPLQVDEAADVDPIAEILAALAYGERAAAARARANVDLAPDGRARSQQRMTADRERENADLVEARLEERADPGLIERFRPFFDAFFEHTEPADWLEAQTFHYVGDALVSDFADALMPLLDPVSATVVRSTIADRSAQASFAIDELGRLMEVDPTARDRIAAYARRIAGEALTQTRRALQQTRVLRSLMGGADELEKRMVLDLLDRHRQRLDRLGIESVDEPADEGG